MQKDPDMLEEYDFSKAVQGKYAKRYSEGPNVAVIEPDVAKVFPDHDSVNQALRSLVEIIRRQKKLASSMRETRGTNKYKVWGVYEAIYSPISAWFVGIFRSGMGTNTPSHRYSNPPQCNTADGCA